MVRVLVCLLLKASRRVYFILFEVIILDNGDNLLVAVIQPSAKLCTGKYKRVDNNTGGVDLNRN